MRNLYLIIIAQVYSYNNTDISKSSDVLFVSRIIIIKLINQMYYQLNTKVFAAISLQAREDSKESE